nr:unnamed protein product [Digitaria exilis]
MLLSTRRLRENSYVTAGVDAANAAKLKASLQIFYFLALAQSVLFCVSVSLHMFRIRRVPAVSREYGFDKLGERLVSRYLKETEDVCAKEGYVPRRRNLIVFAVELLGSDSRDDRRYAVRLLDTFVGKQIAVGPSLLPCKDRLENLMEALEIGDGKTREGAANIVAALAGDLRHIDQFPTALHNIASLLQQQASSEQIRPAADPLVTAPAAGTAMNMERRKLWRYGPLYCGMILLFRWGYWDEKKDEQKAEPKQLISRGLLIIERLTQHQANCEHICSNHGLVSKITAPLTNSHAFLDGAEYDSDWTDILSRSMRIVARLISAPGEATTALRLDGIASEDKPVVANLKRILEDDRFGPVLKAGAIEVLAELSAPDKGSVTSSLGKDDIKKFIRKLWGIFLGETTRVNYTTGEREQQEADSRLRRKAGEALAQMLSAWDAGSSTSHVVMEMFIQTSTGSSAQDEQTQELRRVVDKLTGMLIANRGSRTRAAEILRCLCSHLSEHRQLLRQDVTKMLEKVLQLVIGIPQEANNGSTGGSANSNHEVPIMDVETPRREDRAGNKNEEQHEEKEFMVALLSLAVAICDDRMVDAQNVTCDMVSLVTKLKGIIETNNGATVQRLQIVKLSCQLAISLVQLMPNRINVFTEKGFKDVLSKSALKSLSNLDNCMLFDADYYQVTKTTKPLASLVKEAEGHFGKAQERANGHA